MKWNLSADEKSSFSTDLMMYSPSVGDLKTVRGCVSR